MADTDRLSLIRMNAILSILEKNHVDAVIIAHDDEYLSEELSADKQRIKYLTDFSGSAGYCALISKNHEEKLSKDPIFFRNKNEEEIKLDKNAAIFVDGRYSVQVRKQVNLEIYDTFNLSAIRPEQW